MPALNRTGNSIAMPAARTDTDDRTPRRPCAPGYQLNAHSQQTFTKSSRSLRPYCSAFRTPLAYTLSGFTVYLTLSSECFSTFPHGTCSLSVLWIYLALDRVYDLLSAACQSNATLKEKGRTHPTHALTRV